jgi:hypothetical protein
MADQPANPTLQAAAISFIVEHLKTQQSFNRIPKLSAEAKLALAVKIVAANGVLDPIKNNDDAYKEAKNNPEWEYYGLGPVGRLWLRLRKMMGR